MVNNNDSLSAMYQPTHRGSLDVSHAPSSNITVSPHATPLSLIDSVFGPNGRALVTRSRDIVHGFSVLFENGLRGIVREHVYDTGLDLSDVNKPFKVHLYVHDQRTGEKLHVLSLTHPLEMVAAEMFVKDAQSHAAIGSVKKKVALTENW